VLPVGLMYLRNATIFGFTVTDATIDELTTYAVEINRWLTQGAVRAKIARLLRLSDAAEAHRLVESGGLFGKIVLTPESVGEAE
jgi:NADPH:quinone reductase